MSRGRHETSQPLTVFFFCLFANFKGFICGAALIVECYVGALVIFEKKLTLFEHDDLIHFGHIIFMSL